MIQLFASIIGVINIVFNIKNECKMAASKIRIKKICEYCGQEFYALKTSTRFCSKSCNDRAYKMRQRVNTVKKAESENLTVSQEHTFSVINQKEYLSIKEVGILLGITSRAVYNYIYSGQLKAIKLSTRLTIIHKSDIDSMMSSTPYVKRNRISHTPITDFYTTAEVASKYGVNESWIFKVGKEQNIPKVFKRGKTYWSAKHFDKYFASKAADSNITEWYSVEDLTEKFRMTTSAIYSFVSRFAIPKKKIKRQVFYSKKHVDIAKGLAKAEPEYYTTAEAMEKYNLTRDQLYHYVKWHHISKVQEGKYIKISRKELDDLLAPSSI